MSKGVLVNLTKCIGCGACTVACKMHNANKWIDDRSPTSGENAQLADENWTIIKKFELYKNDDTKVWRFVKNQCLHCQSPACESACFARALRKTDDGAVVYFPDNCVGCRYCMLACPFKVPKFEWQVSIPVITKCVMCYDRLKEGKSPACVAVCPESVMKFGERDKLLSEAKEIINNDSKFVQHIYGEEEAGGTSWIYISDVPFEKIGFNTNVTKKPLPEYTSTYMKCTPIFGAIWAIILTAFYFITKRRNKIKNETTDLSYENSKENNNNNNNIATNENKP
ncbi:MAG: 4Fe-4S dicluster domain-containing protein [Planctomycetaceae bacterium]|jgi:formate dehydrogenase iron-sulfur subunit|nr:4Fe-4S dicluster domain-containing protein [Planctomycetaceae bacterium]